MSHCNLDKNFCQADPSNTLVLQDLLAASVFTCYCLAQSEILGKISFVLAESSVNQVRTTYPGSLGKQAVNQLLSHTNYFEEVSTVDAIPCYFGIMAVSPLQLSER